MAFTGKIDRETFDKLKALALQKYGYTADYWSISMATMIGVCPLTILNWEKRCDTNPVFSKLAINRVGELLAESNAGRPTTPPPTPATTKKDGVPGALYPYLLHASWWYSKEFSTEELRKISAAAGTAAHQRDENEKKAEEARKFFAALPPDQLLKAYEAAKKA